MTNAEPKPHRLQVSMGVTLRPAVLEDLYKLEMDGQFTRFRNLFQRAYREMQSGERLLLIADCNDAPVGRLFILFRSSDNTIADGTNRAYLYSFFIIPPFRGMGLGTRMVQYAERILEGQGFRYVTIAVAKDNDGALRLYERLNYQAIREDPGRWNYTDHLGHTHRMSEPCWILEKTLKLDKM